MRSTLIPWMLVAGLTVVMAASCGQSEQPAGGQPAAQSTGGGQARAAEQPAQGAEQPAQVPAKATTGLDARALEDAYMATFGNFSRSGDSFDVKFEELRTKLGEPNETDGNNLYWYGADKAGKRCTQVKVIKGAGAMMNAASNDKCGL